MKQYTLSQLLYLDFDIHNIAIHPVHFPDSTVNDYQNSGRTQNLLHLVLSGRRQYLLEDQIFEVGEGSILFMPDQTRYKTTALPNHGMGCDGIGICFDLVTASGEPILIKPDIYRDWNSSIKEFDKYFYALREGVESSDFPVFMTKTYIYRLFYSLVTKASDTSAAYLLIEPAIAHIKAHYCENDPVALYASLCKVSESYLRKKFAECMGMSPISYRNKLRFQEARRLYGEGYNIQQISEALGFCNANYFTRLYKKDTGVSLKKDPHIV